MLIHSTSLFDLLLPTKQESHFWWLFMPERSLKSKTGTHSELSILREESKKKAGSLFWGEAGGGRGGKSDKSCFKAYEK